MKKLILTIAIFFITVSCYSQTITDKKIECYNSFSNCHYFFYLDSVKTEVEKKIYDTHKIGDVYLIGSGSGCQSLQDTTEIINDIKMVQSAYEKSFKELQEKQEEVTKLRGTLEFLYFKLEQEKKKLK